MNPGIVVAGSLNMDFAITVEIAPGEIRVAASDSGPGEPVMRKAGPSDVSGRGLAIVDAIAAAH